MTSPRLRQAYLHCDGLARQRARNFYPAFRLLPRPRRLALSAFYAFCTLADDIADEAGADPDARRSELVRWRGLLDRCFEQRLDPDGDPPVFLALSDAVVRFGLPRQPFRDLLSGIEMDLEPRRFATFADLEVYCRCVASTVGRVSVRIFGCTHPGADAYADRLGLALQMTNILRDLAEDMHRRRLYLPLEDLERFDYREEDVVRQVYDRRFRELMEFQYRRAQGYFQAADPRLAGDQARRLLPAQVMKAVYQGTLEELRRQEFRVYARRISLPAGRKLAAVLGAVWRSVRPGAR
ncbi:MAG: squalene synthase HpnD [Candidatus Zixiibacteriota bacterium]|nr:MAG: squalene synthase HpnD [candidate division Zixibacteria bacterium]